MKNKNLFKSFLIVLTFVLAGFLLVNYFSGDFQIKNTQYVKIAGQNVRVELALTDTARRDGLAGRSGLKENEGMLFIFDKPGQYYFWMKGMNFPIDIIWIGEDMRVVSIEKNVRPEDFLETYGPDTNTKYVLEIASGFADKNNLKIGDEAKFMH